ncbi:oligopeptidase A [Sodalis sp. CWE]|uniref:oligopeptidase A n=1 Tax=Sodalis sp. CWE TaxID=2803816 RepID=UPI001C7D769B|nr:oligopeptidase A [Sodalis sp. CWE]MBX4181061.1 oligopeptidase A [Sodalis sp. CWE]
MINPLLKSFFLPPFSSIIPEYVVPAVTSALKHCRNTVEKVIAQSGPFTWENLCQPIAEADNNLSRIWGPINHLNAVKNSKELREAYEKSLLLLSDYSSWIGQNKNLYEAYQTLRESKCYKTMDLPKKKAIDNALRDFELSGINLSKEDQQRYRQIVSRLSALGSTYSNNVLDATMGWSKLITNKKELTGIPESTVSFARARAKDQAKEGWLLTLDAPCYLSVLTYCDNAILREEIYHAYNTRASDQGPNAGKWDNSPVMKEILALRYELAKLLGFNNYAEKSLVTKMAKNPQKVLDFLMDLIKLVRPYGKKELAKLRSFSAHYFHCDTLHPWDISYYGEKQKQYFFSINEEELRPYFPVARVINGLFEVIKRIYGISTKERTNIDTWHPDVRFFDLFNENGELCGSFYLDLYTRDNKRSGAWMEEYVSLLRKKNGELQKPIAYLTCNFSCPMGNRPALLTHSEVVTLFHEFGHGLHHILTCVDTPGVAGINGVPWDAVELPSQFMENYCWKSESIALISGHYETNEPIPNKLLIQILKLKNYQVALFMLRQLELSLFDFLIHCQFAPEYDSCILNTLIEVKRQVSVIPSVPWGRFPHAFNHIFSGGYAAGYYSYLWADVLAVDVWSRFEEEGIFNRSVGKLFLETILSRGGSEDPIVLFSRFRGRKPKLQTMLRHYGFQE